MDTYNNTPSKDDELRENLSIIKIKLSGAISAVEHMSLINSQQKLLSMSHPEIYSPDVHAECMAANIDGICSEVESNFRHLIYVMDKRRYYFTTYSTTAYNVASYDVGKNGAVVSKVVARHFDYIANCRSNIEMCYASNIKHVKIFKLVECLEAVVPVMLEEVNAFINKVNIKLNEKIYADR